MIWWPMVLAVLLQIVPRVVQAWRWDYLLRPVRARFRLLLESIYVSTLMNGILPVCPSDLVRGVMVARRTGTATVRVFSSQAVERAADGIALALMGWLTLRGLQVPAGVNQGLLALIALVGAGVVIGLLVTLQRRRLERLIRPYEPGGRIGKGAKAASLDLLAGAKAVKSWTMPMAISTSFVMLTMQAVSVWLMLYAYRIDLSVFQAAALFGIITIGTLLPNAPASVGPWQFFCVLGLGLFGIPASHAAGFSVIAFVFWTVPSLLIGVVALVISPVSWAELRHGNGPKIGDAGIPEATIIVTRPGLGAAPGPS